MATESARDAAFSRAMMRLTTASDPQPALPEVYETVLDELQNVIPYDWASICYFRSDDEGTLRHEVALRRGEALAGTDTVALDSRRPIVHMRDHAGDHALDQILGLHNLESAALVPFAIADDSHGVLALASRTADGIRPDDLPYLEAFAGVLSLHVEATRSRQAIQRFDGDVQRLMNIGRKISLFAKSGNIIEVATRAVAEGLDTAVAIYTLTDDGIQIRAVHAPDGHNVQHTEFKANRLLQGDDNPIVEAMALVGQASTRPATIRIDIATDEAFASLRDLNCRDILIVPLELSGKAIGAMATFQSHRPGKPRTAPRSGLDALLPRIAVYLAPAIQNSILKQELRSLHRENEAVRRISQFAWQSRNAEEGVSLVARTVSLFLDADMVTLYEMRGDKATWYETYGSILPNERTGVLTLPNAWLQERVRLLEDVIVRELGVDPPLPAASFPYLAEEGLVSFMALPFQIANDIRGNMIIGYRTRHTITAADVRFARSLTHGVAATLMIRRLQAELDRIDGTSSGIGNPPEGY